MRTHLAYVAMSFSLQYLVSEADVYRRQTMQDAIAVLIEDVGGEVARVAESLVTLTEPRQNTPVAMEKANDKVPHYCHVTTVSRLIISMHSVVLPAP
jgi:hypothetical protein